MAWDIATTCGIAFGPAGGTPRSTALWLGELGNGEPERFLAMKRGAADLLRRFRPDVLGFEAALGGTQRDYLLSCLTGILIAEAMDLGIRAVSYNLGTIRKHFLGRHYTVRDFPELKDLPKSKRNSQARARIKAMVMSRCESLGWDHAGSDDRADALALWDYIASLEPGIQAAPQGGLFDGIMR